MKKRFKLKGRALAAKHLSEFFRQAQTDGKPFHIDTIEYVKGVLRYRRRIISQERISHADANGGRQ